MSNTMNPIYIRTANKKPTPKNFDFRHQGTSDFFKPQIVHCQRIIPGEIAKINCNVEMYSRPMAMPAGIRVNHNLRAFWVPAWAMHKDWFRFRTNVPFTLKNNVGTDVFQKWNEDCYMYNDWMVEWFLHYNLDESKYEYIDENSWEVIAYSSTRPTSDPTDVCITVVNEANEESVLGWVRFNFNEKGKLLYNLLVQLGYEIKWIVAWATGGDSFNTSMTINTFKSNEKRLAKDRKISARAILAYMKVMIDWYVPTQYEEYFEVEWESQMNRNTFGNDTTVVETLMALLTWVNYEQDRFTGAWTNPQGPNNENTEIDIADKTVTGSFQNHVQDSSGSSNNTPIINRRNSYPSGNPSALYGITDYMLRALNAVQNFTTRNRIAGYRPIDRMLAHFGVHLDYKLIKRSTYITGSSQHFAQQATANTANLEGALENADWINDKGVIGGAGSSMQSATNIQFTWTAEDDGYIIIVDTILPRVGYYQGMKHHNHQVDWRELYIPEFDNLGTEAIPRSEVFNAYNDFMLVSEIQKQTDNDEQIWGFEPTNAGMKTGYDTLSGDYRRKSLSLGIENMHTLRKFNDTGENVPASVSPNFLKGNNEEYDRIFQYTGALADHFQFLAVVTDKGKAPWASISESLPITDGEGQNAQYNYGGSSYMN